MMMNKTLYTLLTLTLGACSFKQESTLNKEPNRTASKVINKDSIKKRELIMIYDSIKISRHWEKIGNSNNQIVISISTSFETDLLYDTGNSSLFFNISGVVNHSDSVSLKTTNYKKDTTYIWTIKNIKGAKGEWAVFNEQTKKYSILGKYKSVN